MQSTGDNIFVLVVIAIAGSVVLSFAVFYFVMAYVRKTVKHREEIQKREMEYQVQLFASVVNSQEEERRILGKELHDEVSSVLYAIRLRLKNNDNAENVANLKAVEKIITITRNISHLLSPPEIELLGFHDSVKELCNTFSGNNGGIRINLVDDTNGFIPKGKFQLSLMLYRILQELITNTIKHAKATEIQIHIRNAGNTFLITYSDNGIGLDTNISSPSSLGLKNIISRALFIKANYRFETGAGCKFELSLNHKHMLSNE